MRKRGWLIFGLSAAILLVGGMVLGVLFSHKELVGLRIAAVRGDAKAQFMLGRFYALGAGVKQDFK